MGAGLWGWGQTITAGGSITFCQGGSVVLTATAGETSYLWQRDGITITPNVTTNTYIANQSGVYTVLTSPNTNTGSITVVVNPLPVVSFTYSPNSNICSGTSVQFTSNVTVGTAPFTYSWNFGDATALNTNANPTHAFTSLGCGTQTFTVTLTVTDANGCSKATSQTITITQAPDVQLKDQDVFSPFSNCDNSPTTASPNFTLTVSNISPSASCITSYNVNWGDGNTQNNVSFPLSHTYTQLGAFSLVVTAIATNGCNNTRTYTVANQSNPAIGIANLGATQGCAPLNIPIVISSWQGNSPGTTYILNFGDGKDTTLVHPINNTNSNDTIYHSYTTSPCPANSFQVAITANNACQSTPFSGGNIQVRTPPQAKIASLPTPYCVNQSVCFVNQTTAGFYTGCSTATAYLWDFGDPASGSNNTSTDANPCHIFSAPGTYTVSVTSSNPCGNSTFSRQVCIVAQPVPSFTIDNASACSPLTVNATNTSNPTTSCSPPTYNWTVTYTSAFCGTSSSWGFTNSTNASSVNPSFIFNNAGTYTIKLSITNACGTFSTTKTVDVKKPPTVTIPTISGACGSVTFTPTANVTSCGTGTLTYQWTFTGGTPASSTNANPGSVTFSNTGTNTVALSVTNDCGTTSASQNFTISSAPNVTVPIDKILCAGSATGVFTFSSSVPGTTYTWTNTNTAIGLAASGSATSASPNIPSFTAANSTAAPITATITVTPVNGCNGTPQSFTITVNPRPAKPTVTRPVRYCLNETATALIATATGSNTLTWYDNNLLNNGQATAFTPVTTSAGTTTYYVNQENSFTCKSDTSAIAVIVSPLIANNNIGSDQTLCTGTPANTLTQVGTLSGGSGAGTYTYQWQSSTDGGVTWNDIATATSASYSPGNVTATTKYRRKVFSNTCADISAAVTITIQGSLNNINIAAAQTICAGSIPTQLDGETPTGGSGSFTYIWESSLNNTTWTIIASATSEDYAPPALSVTTYYRRKTSSGLCSGYSPSIAITVNPIPMVSIRADTLLCNNSSVASIPFTSTPSTNVTLAWTNDNINIGLAASGSGNLPAFTSANASSPKVPITGNIQVIPTYNNASLSCLGSGMNFKVIVLPNILVSPINNETVCSGTPIASFTPTHDAGAFTGSTVSYSWTVAGTGTNLTAGNGSSIPAFNTNNTSSADMVTTITVTPQYSYNGKTCSGTPTSYTITVRPSTPSANAGADTSLCSATSYTMQAILAAGSTGVWTQLSGAAATITTSSSPTTTITGLTPNNTYKFVWTVTGVAGCPGTTDTVTIINYAAVVNQINNAPQTICATQSITVTGQVPTGGSGPYGYQWQQSLDGGVTWTNIAGQITQSLTFTPAASMRVRRVITALPCIDLSVSTSITVQPAITNNTISSNHSICINTSANSIIGSTPTGGNGIFTYQWQQSIDNGVTWTNIPSATAKDYSPGILTATTKYKRIVSTTLCSGAQGSTSTVVTVTVNPDAKAIFTFTNDKGCAPFNINSTVLQPTLYPAQNGAYNWFANGTSIGNGTNFPGYVLSSPGDSILIKLVTISQFGCKNDSMEHKFYSVPKPVTSFNLSDTVGCGPLTVSFVNTTPNQSWFDYQWNFGNGITSILAQPNSITFATNPTYNDTTYIVKLSAVTVCETVTVSKNVRVKSKPKAVFTPDKSTGCSPMLVHFTNTSRGLGVSYIWNFGDGSASFPASTNAAQNHTFITGVQDTFNVKLIAINECGNDTLNYKIVVAPNTVHLDFAVNGNQTQGCKPHAVSFINASSGATTFQWNFGDGNFLNTIKNIDTVPHTYLLPGTYTVTLKASNGCSDTTSTETIQVFNSPIANFAAAPLTVCIGEDIQFTNQTDTSTSLLWNFKDNSTSTLTNPIHAYAAAGTYQVQLKAFRQYSSGLTCLDSISKPVTIVSKLPGAFTASATISDCVPFTVTFTNQSLPSNNTTWDFGNGNSGTGNTVTYTFTQVGTYVVKMTAINPGGCTYEATKTIIVRGPTGTWQYDHGNICNTPVQFITTTTGTDSIRYNFGDGSFLTTTSNTIYHNYTQAGSYVPTATLYSSLSPACTLLLQGIDTIKIDYVKAGYRFTKQENCGSTIISFTDTSRHYLNINSWKWKFGDGGTSSLQNPQHTYLSTNTYVVQLITTTISGCSDTATYNLLIQVNDKPNNVIAAPLQGCVGQPVSYIAGTASIDAIAFNNWSFSNGLNLNGSPVSNIYSVPGTYTATLITGTVNGCTDTATHTININPTPTIIASADQLICKGQSVQLTASSLATISWTPLNGTLSCTSCSNPVATPLTTTLYVAIGTNNLGCSGKDSVLITVAQPIHVTVSPNDTLCIGGSSQLSVTGATTYLWSPAATLSSTSSNNPIATPSITTRYQVIGFDNHSCFQDTAYVTVAVGQYPTINLGVDKVLATGTKLPLTSTFTNGPITNWLWSPTTDLSCSTCSLPTATIKKDVCYAVTASNVYKCAGRDTICIKVFCEGSQVFIPNGFTPDGDGVNDILMVRGSGIKTVKSFRIFNRWGQVVFERSNISPNDATQGWDGKINGKAAPPEVYVYTCEVTCDNDVYYTYKGNVAILK
jgi:gliding motility-associated-like protein